MSTREALPVQPAPGAAPTARRVLAHAGLELTMMLRNGEQLVLTAVIPVAVLLGLGLSDVVRVGAATTAGRLAVVVPGVLTLAILSTAFTGLAIQTGFERRYGVLKRLHSTPLTRTGLLAGKACAVLSVEVAQLVVLAATAAALGWRPTPDVVAVGLLVIAGTTALAACGLLLAGLLRAEATLAAANLVFLVLLVGGGVGVPLSRFPAGVRRWVELLPTGALSSGLRQALDGHGLAAGALAVLVGWTVVAGFGVARTFRWT